MPDLRILVIDDSVAVRRALTDAIEREPGLAVCGTAPNGALGLELVERSNPDVVVLDLEMPVLDGLDFLARVRPQHPRLPVLVFSGRVGQANEATLEALWRGASDYVLKPHGVAPESMGEFLRTELFPRVRAIARRGNPGDPDAGSAGTPPGARILPISARTAGPGPVPVPRTAAPHTATPRTDATLDPVPSLLVVGASTGGPRALAAALGELPADYPLPIAIVQHMPAEMAEFFASGFSANCRLPVLIAQDGASVERGVIWVAPGGAHLSVVSDRARVHFRLDHGPEINGCRPAVDTLFRSAAQVFGSGVLAVVLTGMGQDGLAGARAVHEARGRVLVQDEPSSVVWGMPGAIARAGLAHAVLPLSQIAGELLARGRRARGTRAEHGPTRHGAGPQAEAA
jgi:two-component system chemotaxis response regulator CheB